MLAPVPCARSPRVRLALTLTLLAGVVSAWSLPFVGVRATRGAHTTGDEPQYLLSALSLGTQGSLDIADERAAGRHRVFHEAPLPIQEEDRPDGRRISPHDPGLPVLLALPMRFGGWRAAKATLALLAGALAALVAWVAHRRFGLRLPLAVGGTAAFAGAPPLVVYATQVYPELPAALGVTAAVAALTGPMRRAGPVTVGLAVVALPWLSVKYLPVAGALAALAAVRLAGQRRWRVLGMCCVAWVCMAVGYVGVHRALYGGLTPYAAGAHFGAGELTVMGRSPDLGGRSLRLVGLLVDRSFGLVPWAPVYLCLPAALGALATRRPRGGAALAVPLAAGWATATWAAVTMHGWWWPGRQVVAVLPLAALGVLWWAGEVAGARGRAVLAVGALAGWAVTAWLAVQGLAGRLALVVDVERGPGPAFGVLLPDLARWAPADRLLLALWALGFGGSALAGARAGRPRPARDPAAPAPPGPPSVLGWRTCP